MVARQLAGIGLLRDLNAASIAASMLQLDAELGPGRLQREALGPFEDDHGGFSENVLEAQRFEIVEVFDAVKISVVDLSGVRGTIYVNERESWAGHFVFG